VVLVTQQTALKELRQQNEVTGVWSNVTDDDISRRMLAPIH
jgi:hypothetical protein